MMQHIFYMLTPNRQFYHINYHIKHTIMIILALNEDILVVGIVNKQEKCNVTMKPLPFHTLI